MRIKVMNYRNSLRKYKIVYSEKNKNHFNSFKDIENHVKKDNQNKRLKPTENLDNTRQKCKH